MLWDELLEKVILHITPLCSLLHILLKDGECVCRPSENCKSLVLQDKCNIEIFLSLLCLFGLVHEILVTMAQASGHGSDETAQMCSLVRAFPARLHKVCS